MRCPSCRMEMTYCPRCGNTLPIPTSPPLQKRAKLIIYNPISDTHISFLLKKDSYLIGRKSVTKGSFPEIDLNPFDSGTHVSRCHARIFRQGDYFFVEDLESINGTYVNEGEWETKITPKKPRRLKDKSRIRFATVMGKFSATTG